MDSMNFTKFPIRVILNIKPHRYLARLSGGIRRFILTSLPLRRFQIFFGSLLVTIQTCKTPNAQTTRTKSAEETSHEVKKDVSDVVKKPSGTLLSFLEPIAAQFNSLQLLKAYADGAVNQADLWAQQEISQLKEKYNENSLLWDTLAKFAGNDGLFNYEDVKNTLTCMGDDDLKQSLDLVLIKEGEKSSGYKRQAIEMLRSNIKENIPLPNYRPSFNPFAFANASTRQDEIQNEINRQVSISISEQCGIPESATRSAGIFDLIKKHCVQAMEWRSQGILVGLFHLHYDSRSIDKGGACESRKITFSNFKDLYTQYILPKSTTRQNSNSRSDALAQDFIKLQTAKYFGPFVTTAKQLTIEESGSTSIMNQYLNIPNAAQITLSGGVPVAAVKSFIDKYAKSRDNNWRPHLGMIREKLKLEMKCNAIKTSFVASKNSKTELGAIPSYKNEQELRAYFDANFNGENYLRSNIKGTEELANALREMKDNKQNSIFRSHKENGSVQFTHQSFLAVNILGTHSPSLAVSQFTQSNSDQKILLKSMYMEQEVDGAFLVTIQKANNFGKTDVFDYEGYSIPYSASQASLETPCIQFSGLK